MRRAGRFWSNNSTSQGCSDAEKKKRKRKSVMPPCDPSNEGTVFIRRVHERIWQNRYFPFCTQDRESLTSETCHRTGHCSNEKEIFARSLPPLICAPGKRIRGNLLDFPVVGTVPCPVANFARLCLLECKPLWPLPRHPSAFSDCSPWPAHSRAAP